MFSNSNDEIDVGKGKFVMIDFDHTFSLAPKLFQKIWLMFEGAGFQVRCCTARSLDCGNDDIYEFIKPEHVIFCEGEQKQVFIKEHLGIESQDVAFWIDDCPENIPPLGLLSFEVD